ncbi:MAG: NYN domain-containing protein [Candidatus Omnitrophota bacterium]|nr:MAG: NYN domain-containing protein [Candidatus Omnitrophota bacterium]
MDYCWLIIDGYNVINKWPELIKAKDKSIEFAREKLNTLVQKYSDFKGIKTTIAYDGKGRSSEELEGNPKIIYSKNKETADAVIESLVYNYDKPGEITVVTDDNIQRNFVIGAGARCISADQFETELSEALTEMRQMLR